ncbi:rod shape-determining protein RodA [Candidatus Palauibacter sp.]|uniref:rod shape-determining protein RodA n=1 Tax=Candidatus Palauibacter sp. TaxID=3101350 RepID=UPI003B024D29
MIARLRIPGVGDPTLLALILFMTGLGIAMIYSAGQVDVPSLATGIWVRQLYWFAVAIVALAVTSRFSLRFLEWLAPWAYGISVLLLVLVFVVGTGPNGSWLELGPGRLQPAEVAKLGTILMLARVMGGMPGPYERLLELWKPAVITLVPFALVLLQPDLGSAMIFGALLLATLFWSGVPLFKIFLLASPGLSLLLGFDWIAWGLGFLAVAAALYVHRLFILESVVVLLANVFTGALTLRIWDSLADYQRNRLLVFLDPEIDPLGAGWHLIQSKVAIGSGGLIGAGFANGPQKRLAFLPEQHTDFIFSVVGEEFGFIGVMLFLVLFAFLLWRVLRVAASMDDPFGSLIAFCLFAVLLTHIVVNLGMTVGMMPVTGLPLPLLSYGGSFLLVLYAGFGIVQRVAWEA